jgi:hypothetical protein
MGRNEGEPLKRLDSRLDTLLVGGSDSSGDDGGRSSLVLTVTEVWDVSCILTFSSVLQDVEVKEVKTY